MRSDIGASVGKLRRFGFLSHSTLPCDDAAIGAKAVPADPMVAIRPTRRRASAARRSRRRRAPGRAVRRGMLILARYDSGAMPPAIYAVVRSIDGDVAYWLPGRFDLEIGARRLTSRKKVASPIQCGAVSLPVRALHGILYLSGCPRALSDLFWCEEKIVDDTYAPVRRLCCLD